jgi:hypothetical protein
MITSYNTAKLCLTQLHASTTCWCIIVEHTHLCEYVMMSWRPLGNTVTQRSCHLSHFRVLVTHAQSDNSSNSFLVGKRRTPETTQWGEIAHDRRRILRTYTRSRSTGLKTGSLSASQRGNHDAYGEFMLSPSDKPFMAPARQLNQGLQIPYNGPVSLYSVYDGRSGMLP